MKLRAEVLLLLLVISCRPAQAQDTATAPFLPEPILSGGVVLTALSGGLAALEERANSRSRALQHVAQEQVRTKR